MPAFPLAQQLLDQAVTAGVAPCAVAEIGDRTGSLWRTAVGRLTPDRAAPPASADTVFDLASLTKVLAAASVAMRLVDERRLDLSTRVADVVPGWRGLDRAAVSVADLLAHSSGLPGHQALHRTCSGPAEFERAICSEPLVYRPGSGSVYSDLGFILLGFLLERVAAEPLNAQFERLLIGLEDEASGRGPGRPSRTFEVRFRPPADWLQRVAPTRAGVAHLGVAHDENAAALNGVAGHAGLFGTAPAVGALARTFLRAVLDPRGEPALAGRETVRRFVSRAGTPGSSRAFGWDTMLPSSSCGAHMSARAFGHTGFTGTSLWIDPEAGIYVVLLTNRVYPEPGSAEGVNALRRAFHDAVMTEGAFSNRSG